MFGFREAKIPCIRNQSAHKANGNTDAAMASTTSDITYSVQVHETKSSPTTQLVAKYVQLSLSLSWHWWSRKGYSQIDMGNQFASIQISAPYLGHNADLISRDLQAPQYLLILISIWMCIYIYTCRYIFSENDLRIDLYHDSRNTSTLAMQPDGPPQRHRRPGRPAERGRCCQRRRPTRLPVPAAIASSAGPHGHGKTWGHMDPDPLPDGSGNWNWNCLESCGGSTVIYCLLMFVTILLSCRWIFFEGVGSKWSKTLIDLSNCRSTFEDPSYYSFRSHSQEWSPPSFTWIIFNRSMLCLFNVIPRPVKLRCGFMCLCLLRSTHAEFSAQIFHAQHHWSHTMMQKHKEISWAQSRRWAWECLMWSFSTNG